MRLKAIAFVLLCGLAEAQAAPVNLSCEGELKDYGTRIDANIPPAASTVDLERRVLKLPLGSFNITRADDQIIWFGGDFTAADKTSMTIQGSMDRTTGRVTAIWYRPEELAKMHAGQRAQASMFMELRCSASKRLF